MDLTGLCALTGLSALAGQLAGVGDPIETRRMGVPEFTTPEVMWRVWRSMCPLAADRP